ncbi:MAG: GLUG motif-containing protein [Gemmiger sp.]|nr:GLUG motif-containing protein [Gemmiger sp.]
MRKFLSGLVAACMAASLLTGCGTTAATSAASSAGVAATTAEVAAPTVQFAGGTGTEADPYQIATAAQFAAFAASVNDGSCQGYGGQYLQLAADVDLAGTAWVPIGNMSDMETHSTMFLGTFDGAGHTVSNLTYQTEEPTVGAGLFGLSAGTIENLNVENVTVTVTDATSQAIGGVVGYNMGLVDAVNVSNAAITGNNCTGGLLGGNSAGTVTNCTATDVTVTVLGDNDFSAGLVQADVAECGGLLIGGGFGGKVENCTASGTVKATGKEPVGLGGIGGCLEMMDAITNCTADVTIEAPNGGHAIGGLCGYAGTHTDPDVVKATEGFSTTSYPGVIENCTAQVTINANGATHVGGLVGTGLYYYGEETAFAIRNCTVNGSINGAATPGSVAGRAVNSSVAGCTVSVTADGAALAEEIGTTACRYESADQYEEGSEPAATSLMKALNGSYEELWPVLLQSKYDDLWLADCKAIVGEDALEDTVTMLKTACTGTVIGQQAVDAYAGQEARYFDCDFMQDVAQFTFADGVISGVDANGKPLFSHSYQFLQYDQESGFYIYQSQDADAGEFTYFAMAADTPASTQHIEFRYGSNLAALGQYDSGDYAYWMAAGIPVNSSDEFVAQCIQLFCTENLQG